MSKTKKKYKKRGSKPTSSDKTANKSLCIFGKMKILRIVAAGVGGLILFYAVFLIIAVPPVVQTLNDINGTLSAVATASDSYIAQLEYMSESRPMRITRPLEPYGIYTVEARFALHFFIPFVQVTVVGAGAQGAE